MTARNGVVLQNAAVLAPQSVANNLQLGRYRPERGPFTTGKTSEIGIRNSGNRAEVGESFDPSLYCNLSSPDFTAGRRTFPNIFRRWLVFSNIMDMTHVAVTIRNPADLARSRDGLFLVDTGATDSLGAAVRHRGGPDEPATEAAPGVAIEARGATAI